MSTVFSSLKIKIKILLFCCNDKLSYTRDHLVTDRGYIRIKQNNEKMLIITFLQWRNKRGALFPVITGTAECSGSAHSGRTFTVEGFGYQYKGTELNIKRTFSATTFPINQPHFINHLMRLDHSRHLWQLEKLCGATLTFQYLSSRAHAGCYYTPLVNQVIEEKMTVLFVVFIIYFQGAFRLKCRKHMTKAAH